MKKKDPWYDKDPYKEGWPRGVRPLLLGDDAVGVDRKGDPYFDGRKLAVKELTLSTWQKIGGVLVAVGTFLAGVSSVLPYFGIMPPGITH